MWVLQPAKSPKLVIFGINLPKRGIPPYAIFIKFWLGRESHVRTSMPNFIVLSFKKCGPTASKIAKNRIFGINLLLTKGKFTESTENVEYRCTVTNLPLCNDTINVLKITLLHSVSVITNFVIPKRDKKQTDKKTSHFFVLSRRATHDPLHTWLGDRGGPYHFCIPYFFWSDQ